MRTTAIRLYALWVFAILVPGVAAASSVSQMARDYAPRVVLHPEEQYGIGNVYHFMKRFKLVLSTPLKSYSFDVTPSNIAKVTHKGWVRSYATTDKTWKDNWSFESKDGCDWSSKSQKCDLAYLRATDPVAAYSRRVKPHVYWRARRRSHNGKRFTVIQYFFLMMLNDAQNKHDGEWESSVVVVDEEAYKRAGKDYRQKREALSQILMAGHYRHEPFDAATVRRNADRIFVPGTAHYQHVMSLGGHGGYLLTPKGGRSEASFKCYEVIQKSKKYYDTWKRPVRMVAVGSRTPWIRYVGRWGRRYGVLSRVPFKIRLRRQAVATCDGALGSAWLKSRVQVIGSAPFGPKFIHTKVWNWSNFPSSPGSTPKSLR